MKVLTKITQLDSQEQAFRCLYEYFFQFGLFHRIQFHKQKNDLQFIVSHKPPDKLHESMKTLIEEGKPNPNKKIKATKQTFIYRLKDEALDALEQAETDGVVLIITRKELEEKINLLEPEFKNVIVFYSNKKRTKSYLDEHVQKTDVQIFYKKTEAINKLIEVMAR